MSIEIKVVFLDDNRARHNMFAQNNETLITRHVFNADDCLYYMKKHDDFDIVFLDHDLDAETNNELNDDEKDGRYVAKMMTEPEMVSRYSNRLIIIHSLNEEGRLIMKETLVNAGYKNVFIEPFVWDMNVRKSLNKWI